MSSYLLNLTFPAGHKYFGLEYQSLLFLNSIELFAHIFLDGPFSAINFLLISKSSVLHPNLKFILQCQSACIFIRAIGRVLLNGSRIWLGNLTTMGPFLLQTVYFQSTYLRNLIIHVLVIERIMATLFFKKYEKWRGCWFSVAWFSITSLIALFNTLAGLIFPTNLVLFFSFVTFIATFMLGIVEVAAFLWIRKYNERIYLMDIFTLSEKYQLSENIRTAKQLIPCIFLHFINIVFGTTQSLLNNYKLLGTDQFNYDLVAGQLVFTSSTIISFFIEVCMILCHPFLRRELVRLWNALKRWAKYKNYISHRNNSVEPAINGGNGLEGDKNGSVLLMNIHGEPLLQNERDDLQSTHFKQLSMAWDNQLTTKN